VRKGCVRGVIKGNLYFQGNEELLGLQDTVSLSSDFTTKEESEGWSWKSDKSGEI